MGKLLALVVGFVSFSCLSAQDLVYLYTYHKKPPFIVSQVEQQGFYYDLAKLLSEQSDKFNFKAIYVPRKRLDVMVLRENFDGLVVGVSPAWFKDKEEKKFLWTQGFFSDRDEFVSLTSSPFEYSDSESLKGKVIGSVAGYYYFGVNEGVRNGDIQRVNTVGELEVLKLIEKQRVDVGLVSNSVFKYLRKAGVVNNVFHFSKQPHDEFLRRAFTTPNNSAVHKEVVAAFARLEKSGKLQETIEQYQ